MSPRPQWRPRSIRVAVILRASLVLVALTRAGAARAVVSGEDGGDDAVVALVRDEQVVCSGTLVSPTEVLSAAHCFADGASTSVLLGASIATASRASIGSVSIHPRYDRATLAHDVAIASLVEPILVAPAALPPAALSLPETLTIVGFGRASNLIGDSAGTKRRGSVRLVTSEPERLELAPGPALTCGGDSGGAIFAEIGGERVLVGVVSAGDVFCKTRTSGVRVDAADPFFASLERPNPRSGCGTRTKWPVVALLALGTVLSLLGWVTSRHAWRNRITVRA